MGRFKIQFAIIAVISAIFTYVILYYPSNEPTIYIDVLIEGVMAISCLFLMFFTETLKDSREVYRTLIISSCLLFSGHYLDVIDEFTISLALLDALEATFKPLGFLLFIAGSYRWVRFHENQSEQLKHLAEVDPLTGLLNRRAFTEKAQSLLLQPFNENQHVSVIVFDIDHFKGINDSHGHGLGDRVLTEVAAIVKSTLKKNDHVARLGGEEFVVLLNDTGVDRAKEIAEEIRTNIEAISILHRHQQIQCTVSLGIVSEHAVNTDITTLIERADMSLYQAKSDGRNCWRVAV
ncbi:hypothetical protein BIT28_27610 [Photobacterium proteolyticum]|uniref:diguanylate cyclase n=1 Tax=Photobacterium proteolyticum TaxID=1903952 RepID=A0A1Q9H164_9GAMM|nr:GGDEF domain-containing protein [Photobacterium proteolyticum]OLQ81367.1 hypothetical protein BIT28_27610 [Photobacterium proteolyticum]